MGLKVWPVSNYTQQMPTSANIVVVRCKRTQYVGPNNVACFWLTMLRPFVWALTLTLFGSTSITAELSLWPIAIPGPVAWEFQQNLIVLRLKLEQYVSKTSDHCSETNLTFFSANEAVCPPCTSSTAILLRWMLLIAMGWKWPRGSGPSIRISFKRITPLSVVPDTTVPTPFGVMEGKKKSV